MTSSGGFIADLQVFRAVFVDAKVGSQTKNIKIIHSSKCKL
jgi:hypothetical protein